MIRNAFKSVIRGWRKSLLFWVLIVLIALFFISGTALAVSMKRYSDDTDASYRSVGLFEYVGDAYPDETIRSEEVEKAAAALSALHPESDPRVEQWDMPVKTLACNAAIVRTDREIPYYESAVLLVKTGASRGDPWYWYATVEKELYSVRKAEGKRIKLNTYTISLEPEHYYLIHGYYTVEGTPIMILNVHSFRNAKAEADGLDGDIERMVLDVTDPDGGCAIPQDCPLLSIAETYRVLNDGLTMVHTADVESLLPFEQEALFLKAGRFFTPEEYANGDPVCILTEWVADRLGAGVGDAVCFSVVSDPACAFSECYWHGTGFDTETTYTVAGVTNADEENLHCIFVPKSAVTPQNGNFTYTLGVARLDNDGAEAFYTEILPKLPKNVRLLLYDQGWSAVSGPLKTVRKTVAWLFALCAAAMTVLTVVFGFLFVYGDRRTAQIMTRLGTNAPKIYGHYLIGAGSIAATAASAGTLLSAVLLPKIAAAIDRTLTSPTADHTLDFSNAALSFARPLKPFAAPSAALLLLIGGSVVLLSVFSCTLFAHAAIKKPLRHRETVSRRTHRGRSRSLCSGPVRYAALSIVRGGARSAAPLLVILLCTVLILELFAVKQTCEDQLAAIRRDTKIKGVYTDLSGRRTDGLLIEGHLIRDLKRTGLVEDLCVSAKLRAFYIGRLVTDGETETVESGRFDATPQNLERYADLLTADLLIFTDDMLRHPCFGTGAPDVNWLEGYDASVFRSDTPETVTKTVAVSRPIGPKGGMTTVMSEQTETVTPMVAPERFLEAYALKVGDLIVQQPQQLMPGQPAETAKYRIVGSYHSSVGVNRLFCPLVYFLPPALLDDETDGAEEALLPYTFENAQFTLKHSDDLPALKAFLLESGCSEVRQIRKLRTFVVLNDSSFLYTTAQLEKRIAALPSFCPPAIGVAIAVACIVVFLRRKEAVTILLLGTGRFRAWLDLWLEQALLCAVGVGSALIGFLLYRHALPPEGVDWIPVLSAGYLLGAALSAALLCLTKPVSRSKEV